jgi:hypothetical protein
MRLQPHRSWYDVLHRDELVYQHAALRSEPSAASNEKYDHKYDKERYENPQRAKEYHTNSVSCMQHSPV